MGRLFGEIAARSGEGADAIAAVASAALGGERVEREAQRPQAGVRALLAWRDEAPVGGHETQPAPAGERQIDAVVGGMAEIEREARRHLAQAAHGGDFSPPSAPTILRRSAPRSG